MSEETLRESFRAMDSDELLSRWAAQSFSEIARPIARAEIEARGLETSDEAIEQLKSRDIETSTAVKRRRRGIYWEFVIVAASMFGFGLSKVLGMALLIPIAFGFVSFFVLVKIDKRLKARSKTFGGLGIALAEDVPYKGLAAVELGHVLWGALGIGIYLFGSLKSSEIQFDTTTFIEVGVFLLLVAFFLFKPNWLSIVLLVAYHCAAIYGINTSMDSLSGFSKASRDSLERAYITHGLFHGMALFGLVWVAYVLLFKRRNPAR